MVVYFCKKALYNVNCMHDIIKKKRRGFIEKVKRTIAAFIDERKNRVFD